MNQRDKEIKELMGILQEECSEVIQAVSKINRFGMDSVYNESSNRDKLEQEIGDVMATAMILSLRHRDLFPGEGLAKAIEKKVIKLKKYVPFLKDFDLESELEKDDLGT